MVLMGGSGAVLYMLILKVFLRLYDVGLSGVNGINAVGLDTLRSLPLGLKNAYFDFYAYFFTHGIAQNHYGQIAGYLLLFVLAALAGLRWLVVLHDRKAAAAAVVLVALLPAAANVTDVINTGATVALRMAGSLAIVVPFAIAVIDAAPALTERAFSWGMALCTAFCAVLLRGFAVQVNNDAAVMLKQKTTVVNLANRLCTRLEENADYQNGARGRDPGRAEARRVPGGIPAQAYGRGIGAVRPALLRPDVQRPRLVCAGVGRAGRPAQRMRGRDCPSHQQLRRVQGHAQLPGRWLYPDHRRRCHAEGGRFSILRADNDA